MPLPKKTGAYIDDLIMSGTRQQNGPAVIDYSKIFAAHSADRANKIAQNEAFGGQMAMAQKRLDQNTNQFDKSMGFKRDQFDYQKNQQTLANVISGVGTGVSAFDSVTSMNRQDQIDTEMNNWINDLKTSGDSSHAFYAKVLQYLNARN